MQSEAISKIIGSSLFNEFIEKMPIHHRLINRVGIEQFSNLIGFSSVITPNTLPMLVLLLKHGLELEIVLDNNMIHDRMTVELLQDAGIRIEQNLKSKVEYAIDIGGYFADKKIKGVVEATRSGIHKYLKTKKNVIIIDADNSQTKLLETFIGNPKAVLQAFSQFKEDPKIFFKDKKIAIIGFGKIGRGLAREFSKITEVKVIDTNERALKIAKTLDFEIFQPTSDRMKNTNELLDCSAIFTATGISNIMTKFYEKSLIEDKLKINIGAVDEWGQDYTNKDVFMSKDRPFNFNLTPPTNSKYIDPILVAQYLGFIYLLRNEDKLDMRYIELPSEIDNFVIETYKKLYNTDLSIIEKYFPDR